MQKSSRATKNIARSKSKFSLTALEVALSSSFEVLSVKLKVLEKVVNSSMDSRRKRYYSERADVLESLDRRRGRFAKRRKASPSFSSPREEENLSIATGTGTNLTVPVEEGSDAVDLGSPGRTPLSPPTVTPGKLSS